MSSLRVLGTAFIFKSSVRARAYELGPGEDGREWRVFRQFQDAWLLLHSPGLLHILPDSQTCLLIYKMEPVWILLVYSRPVHLWGWESNDIVFMEILGVHRIVNLRNWYNYGIELLKQICSQGSWERNDTRSESLKLMERYRGGGWGSGFDRKKGQAKQLVSFWLCGLMDFLLLCVAPFSLLMGPVPFTDVREGRLTLNCGLFPAACF